MSVISGNKILEEIKKGTIIIDPFNREQLGPNSYNVRLHNEIAFYKDDILDMKQDNAIERIIIPKEGYVLYPNQLYLARTVEYTETQNFVPMIDGRSSVGRLGLAIHVTAGFGDVGFKGYWTLEMHCLQPIRIYPNVEIGQLYYSYITSPYEEYKGKYQSNKDIQASMMWKDFK